MGKVSPKERETKRSRQKRRSKSSSNKYLKPGALAQLRYSKASRTRSCTDLGKKRVALLNLKKGEGTLLTADEVLDRAPHMLSPVSLLHRSNRLQDVSVSESTKGIDDGMIKVTPTNRNPVFSTPTNFSKQNNLLRTPRTPQFVDCDSESRLEALPMDLLVLLRPLELLYLHSLYLFISLWRIHTLLNLIPFGGWTNLGFFLIYIRMDHFSSLYLEITLFFSCSTCNINVNYVSVWLFDFNLSNVSSSISRYSISFI
ncbi:hypothetical protein SAY86_019224 [Trapa natans]|uniref:Uncharacterized protein n=1 Tax=Trapa natans TaxID=22666 RepID=A0AAN7LEI7_TRANT|nr:hypothetical protein SAY86_019224 [Trapa natans]